MTTIYRLLFLLISIFAIISLWSFAAGLVLPYLSKIIRPYNMEKIYFGILSFPFFFLLGCPIFCEISRRYWPWFVTNIFSSRLESSHCNIPVSTHGYQNYCTVGLIFIAMLFIINLWKYLSCRYNYKSIPLNELSGGKGNRLKVVIQGIERKIGNKFPPLELITSHSHLAFTKGIFWNRFYISRNLISDLSPDEMESLLIHEWKHYQRKDNLRKFILTITQSLNLWPGLRKKLIKSYDNFREIACDEAAMLISRKPLEIAFSIVKVGKLNSGNYQQTPGYVSAFISPYSSEKQITNRVHNLISHSDASQKQKNYFEKLSCHYKIFRRGVFGGFAVVMLLASNAGCLENYLMDLYRLIESTVYLL